MQISDQRREDEMSQYPDNLSLRAPRLCTTPTGLPLVVTSPEVDNNGWF